MRHLAILLISALALALSLGASSGSMISSDPAPMATAAQSMACLDARAAVAKAQTTLTKAERALKKARTRAAKKRARARVAKAKSALKAAKTKRATACATVPTTPTGPGTTPPPTTPTTPTPPANQPPAFPNPVSASIQTNFSYDPNTGYLTGATSTISISTPPTDPNGDPLTYSWTATNGSIAGNGLSATWTRVISAGRVQPGTATVTVSDGRGGTDSHGFVFN